MKEKFIITVTNNIEGCPIEKYFDPICSNVVIGTNIFSDLTASLSDIFGGFSGTYQNKLETIYEKATASLKEKAVDLGANAIIGFSVDFDEISGGGKSMFMISASGTACIIKHAKKEEETRETSVGILSQRALDLELRRRFIIKSISEETTLTSNIEPEWMEFLYEHPQKEILEKLLDKFVAIKTAGVSYNDTLFFITKYISSLPKEDVIDIIYSKAKENSIIKTLIKNCDLFSPLHVLSLAKENHKSALFLLDANADYYQNEDLRIMKEILNIYDTLPNTGKVELVKGGFLSKDEEKFICEHGHASNSDSEFCSVCGVNVKGLTTNQVKKIEESEIR